LISLKGGRTRNSEFVLKLRHRERIKNGGESCQENNKSNIEEQGREMRMSWNGKNRKKTEILKKEEAVK